MLTTIKTGRIIWNGENSVFLLSQTVWTLFTASIFNILKNKWSHSVSCFTHHEGSIKHNQIQNRTAKIMHRHMLHTTKAAVAFCVWLWLLCVFYVGLSLYMCFQSGNAPSTLGCSLNPLIWTTCIKSKVSVQMQTAVQLHLQSFVKYVIDRLFSPLSQGLNHQLFYRDSLCTSHFAWWSYGHLRIKLGLVTEL